MYFISQTLKTGDKRIVQKAWFIWVGFTLNALNSKSILLRSVSLWGFFCCPRNSTHNEADTGQSHTVAPHFVLSRIGVRILQPLYNLLLAFRFTGYSHNFAMDFKNLRPLSNFRFGRFGGFYIFAPVWWELLKHSTFSRNKAAHGVC